MKRCTETKAQPKPEFPFISGGDTVRNIDLNWTYLVKDYGGRKELVNMSDGNLWSSTDNHWGDSSPSDWEKIECCYTVNKCTS